ncbi:cytochrome P450 [Wolfiporia cocos MD-104 SS10]|uniref:Cytochrome P450 n=1 Tax=Wolfiporia cocos (strain MD-104) TaxID=742152 RepID=A0A2H3J8T5_WOLCO|nr:cytochrome P450 [Wolfiporia cocos MD-104 SS10]
MIIPYHDMILLDYGDRWRMHRRWIQNTLSNKASLVAWQIAQKREVSVLLISLIAEPDQFLKHVRRYSAALIMEIAYGYTVKSADDQYVVTMTEAMEGVAGSGNAGATIVDFFPVLKYIPTWMPGAAFKRKAIATQHIVREAVDAPFEWVKKQMKAGIANQSIMSQLIEESEKKGTLAEDELDLRGVGGAVFGAGTDTTSSVLATFALTMVLHPQVLRKAQEEIDRVVGPDRLPEFSDRAALPYVESVINEVYRWNVSAPLGIPHCASEDDEFLGYRVAKGTMVIPNIWAMSQKEDIYPDPQEFRPERFMAMGASEMETADPRNYIFGFGRRICPGRHFADSTIWIAVANLIATMNIRETKNTGSERKSTTLAPSFVPGIVSHPQPFDCCIEPRSARSEALITQLRVATDG